MRGAAWAPAHITCYFSVPPGQEWDTPLLCGSTGAGLCLDIGVLARVSLSDDPYINISHNDRPASDPVTRTTVKGLLPQGWGADIDLLLGAPLTALEAEDDTAGSAPASSGDTAKSTAMGATTTTTRLPLGAGLGLSGACALAAGVATLIGLGEWDGSPRPGQAYPAKAVANAHIAEVLHRTGLGDVAGQAACFAAAQPLEVRRFPGVGDLRRNVETCGWDGVAVNAKQARKAAYKASLRAAAQAGTEGAPTPARERVVLCLSKQKVSTRTILEDEQQMELVRRAGARVKRSLGETPTTVELTRFGLSFALEAGLVPSRLQKALEMVGGLIDTQASVALLGATLYGVGDVEGLVEAWQEFGQVVVCRGLGPMV